MTENFSTKLREISEAPSTKLDRWLRPALALAAILLLAIAIYFGVEQNVAGTAAAATPAVFCLIFVYLHRFSEVAVLGFKAKLLDDKINRVDAIVTKLTALSATVAKANLLNLTFGNRMASVPVSEKRDLAKEFDSLLANLNYDATALSVARRRFLAVHAFDVSRFTEQIWQELLNRAESSAIAEYNRNNAFDLDSVRTQISEARSGFKNLDVQDIFKQGDAERFYSDAVNLFRNLNFSFIPEFGVVGKAALNESRKICQEIFENNELTDKAVRYLELTHTENAIETKIEEIKKLVGS